MEKDAPLKSTDVDDLLGAGRGARDQGASRRSREFEDRKVTENREMTDAERLEMFLGRNSAEILPNLPEIPGYHTCWLSTEHSYDTIPSRLQRGYELIRAEDVPGFEHASLKTGTYEGCIGVKEMIAAKIPTDLYQRVMQHYHHEEPARQEEAIRHQIDALKDQAGRDGGAIAEGDGTAGLRQSAPVRGVFTE